MNDNKYTLLALGDSYTIGESVAPTDNFPHQTIELLKKNGYDFKDPEIIAKTGWTTDELQAAINQAHLTYSYDFVTLLIGVNNQYRGCNINEYAEQFEKLLQQAIYFSGKNTYHIIVISIPDWGVTPFANDRDRNKIAEEIDAFNDVNKKIASQYHVHYIDITPGSREASQNKTLVAGDGLHPSGIEYARWASLLSELIQKIIIKNRGSQL